ncbi:MAG: 16S rRNA (uracil(1498)-N(3))-methyltransferase [Sandaracinaceae bacterium]|nr:16S rRNA (uracil(1498)-N(3))-methyltransferase [Sandaracinaceae bacterium]
MSARRLACAPLPRDGGRVVLDEAARRHARVLRLCAGESVVLFDGEGGEADATIAALDPLTCDAGPRRVLAASPQRVVLCYCLPKGNAKLDLAIRGATEVGVAAIHLVVSERSVSRPEARAIDKKRERLARVAEEAARQSGRATVPTVHPPAPLDEVAARAPERAALLACAPGGAAMRLAGVSEAWLLVGPEGGLADAELALLERAGWARVALGETTLRTETAAIVAPALALAAMRG